MENLKCRSCKKELTADMEVEYSQFLTEFFCGPDCATNHYFDYMQSTPADLQDAEFLNDHELKIVDGKLVGCRFCKWGINKALAYHSS